jgi:hypothetical protein
MAGDLIPPPSPAGRPAPDAPAQAQIPPPPAAEEPPAATAPAGAAPFRGRFGFLWGALAGVAACAAAVTIALLAAPGHSGPPLAKDFSPWKPSTSRMLAGAADIASHVSREYVLPSGEQLVSVRSSRIELEGRPLGVAVRPKGGELQVLKGDGLMYLLASVDPTKAAKKKGSATRERMLRREAVELALYSFRYLQDITMVAVVLPPPAAKDDPQSRPIFYRPGDLLAQLQKPLARTMAGQAQVDSLALRNLFHFSIQPLDGELSYLVLVEPDVVK